MADCDFCGDKITKGMGKMYVKKDGKVLHFCSNKCEKNLLKLKRKARTTPWTKEYAKVKAVQKAAEEQKKPKEKKEVSKE